MSTSNKVRVTELYEATSDVAAMRLSAHALVEQTLAMTDLHARHRTEMLSIAMWKLTEAAGVVPNAKYNVRFCSKGVVLASPPEKVNHEHVHPRKWMVDELVSGRVGSEDLVEFLDTYGVGCIVTVAEHGRLSASRKNGWARYVDAGVEVFDRSIRAYVDLNELAGVLQAPEAQAMKACPPDVSVENAIVVHAKGNMPALLHRLNRMVRLGLGTTALHKGNGPPLYFRVYDALIEEPTRSAAYVKWNGDVDLALSPSDVPDRWNVLPFVKENSRGNSPFLVRVVVGDDESVAVAEELLAMAMDKVRQEFWA